MRNAERRFCVERMLVRIIGLLQATKFVGDLRVIAFLGGLFATVVIRRPEIPTTDGGVRSGAMRLFVRKTPRSGRGFVAQVR
jgi:hypothetical protein